MENRLPKILVGLTFFLILWGGIVHNTESSLACPDWPLCFGRVMPKMEGRVAIEHGHRMLAATVGLLTILLAVRLRKKPGRRLALAAVFLVIFQGALGGITVIYRLPSLVSTAHLATSMLFFAVVIRVARKTSPPAPLLSKERVARGRVRSGRGWILATLILVYLQLLLGAFIRHTGAGLACPDIPFCHGDPWPSYPSQWFHMLHRWLGLLVFLIALPLPFILKKRSALLVPLLVLLQIGLGIASVETLLGLPAVTAHLGVGALLWGVMVSLAL